MAVSGSGELNIVEKFFIVTTDLEFGIRCATSGVVIKQTMRTRIFLI